MKQRTVVVNEQSGRRPAGRLLSFLLPLLLLGAYGALLSQKIFFVSSDLGRHIKNGELILSSFSRAVLTTNFYSFTTPDFPVLNHHWGMGVLFYLGWKFCGMAGLQALFVAVRLATLWLFFDLARRRAGMGVAAIVGAILLFVMAERTEIRPEIFSCLFAGVFWWLLVRARTGGVALRWLWLLPLLEAAWVNLHIYFFLGPAIIGAFFLEFLLVADPRWRLLAAILATSVLATLLNPFGVHGAIAPLTIFQNYGLSIAENQSVFFILRSFGGLTYVLFVIMASVLTASFVATLWRNRSRVAWSDLLLGTGVIAMGCLAIRNLALFALFALPLLAGNLALLLGDRTRREQQSRAVALVALVAMAVFIAAADLRKLKFWNASEFGLGIEAGNNDAAEFFRRHRIAGPVFNNFDLGGYLIFHFWPGLRVFVDNRPEAYPAEFFRDVYWPMLKDRDAWERREAEHRFNAIFFTHTDRSAAAQQFLIDRLNDPNWAVVFCDAVNVIFVRRRAENADVIAGAAAFNAALPGGAPRP